MPEAKQKELKKIECDPSCGFMVRDHDEKELVEMVKQHVKKAHGREMTEEEIKQGIEPA